MDNLGRDMIERIVYFVVRNTFEEYVITSFFPNAEERMKLLFSVLYPLNSLFGSCQSLHQEKKRLMDPVCEVLFCFIYTTNDAIQDKIPETFPNDLFFFKQLCPPSSKYFKYTSSLRLKYRFQVVQQTMYGQMSYEKAVEEYDTLMSKGNKLIQKYEQWAKNTKTAERRLRYHNKKHLLLVEKDNLKAKRKKVTDRIEAQKILDKFWNSS